MVRQRAAASHGLFEFASKKLECNVTMIQNAKILQNMGLKLVVAHPSPDRAMRTCTKHQTHPAQMNPISNDHEGTSAF